MTHPLDPFTYILDANRKPVQHANDDDWFRWFSNMDNRRVALTFVGNGDVMVSTVFGGIDRNYGRELPLFFETRILGGNYDGMEWLSSSWEAAENCHAQAIAFLRENPDEMAGER